MWRHARAVVADFEVQHAVGLGQVDPDGSGAGGVLHRVLHCLDTGEVDGTLHLHRVTRNAVGCDSDRQWVVQREPLQRGCQAEVGQHRRVDTLREQAQLVDRKVRLGSKLVYLGTCGVGIGL